MNQIKLTDVAKDAGVSTATVSYVLNGKGNISREVRERVIETVHRIGYRKNIYASATAKGGYNHLAILVYEDYEKAFEWNFIRQMIIQLEASISLRDLYPVMIPIKIGASTKELYAKIQSSGTGGLFSIHYVNQELFTMLEDSGLPVVIINNSSLQDKFSTVCADDFQGAYEGTKRLLELGHRNIGYLEYYRPDMSAFIADSFIGFQKALAEFKVQFDLSMKFSVDVLNMKDLSIAATSGRHQLPPGSIHYCRRRCSGLCRTVCSENNDNVLEYKYGWQAGR